MLSQQLIKSALSITGKKMEGISEYTYNKFEYCYELDLSIEKFCYYLLSPEFIEKYTYEIRKGLQGYITDREQAQYFGNAIRKYQSGNEKPLIELLEKI